MRIAAVSGKQVHGLPPPTPLFEPVQFHLKAFRPAVHIQPAPPATHAIEQHPQEISDLVRIASEGNVLAQRPVQTARQRLVPGQFSAHGLEVHFRVARLRCAQRSEPAESRHFPLQLARQGMPAGELYHSGAAPGQRFHLLLFARQPLLLQAAQPAVGTA